MHRLVQDPMQRWSEADGSVERWKGHLVGKLSVVFPPEQFPELGDLSNDAVSRSNGSVAENGG